MASTPGSQYVFTADQTVNVVRIEPGSDPNNPPPPVPGQFNLELIIQPSGTNFPTPSGYQGAAVAQGTNGETLTLLAGNFAVMDNASGDLINAGSGNQTITGGANDTINGGTGNVTI